jgi:hypothetical protein
MDRHVKYRGQTVVINRKPPEPARKDSVHKDVAIMKSGGDLKD